MARFSRKCSVYFFSSQKHTWRPMSYHSSFICEFHSQLPDCPPSTVATVLIEEPTRYASASGPLYLPVLRPGMLFCKFQSLPTSYKSPFKSIFSVRPSLTIPYKVTSLSYPPYPALFLVVFFFPRLYVFI